MHTQHFTFASKKKGEWISALICIPQEGEPVGLVQLCHGMSEHKERYLPFARFLCDHGFVVGIHDHLGHGQTAKNPQFLGYFGAKGPEYLRDDLHTMTVEMKKRYPRLPLFLLGHSMGSFITRYYLASYGRELQGAVIMGTAGKNPACDAGIRMARLVAKMKSPYHRSMLLHRMAFGGYNKKYTKPRTENDWLSREEGVVNDYFSDPKCGFVFTANGFETLFTLLKRVSQEEIFQNTPKELPLLVIAGDMDPVGDYGKGPTQVAQRYRQAGVTHVELELRLGARHEVLNETDKEEVYERILEFFQEQLPS